MKQLFNRIKIYCSKNTNSNTKFEKFIINFSNALFARNLNRRVNPNQNINENIDEVSNTTNNLQNNDFYENLKKILTENKMSLDDYDKLSKKEKKE